MAPSKPAANSLNDMVNEDRKRRKNASLAQEIFSKNRRASAPGGGVKAAGKAVGNGTPSLFSRIGSPGITKRGAAPPTGPAKPVKARTPPVGNVNADWTHDLHPLNNPSAAKPAARLPPRGPKAMRNHGRLQNALNGSASSPALNSQYNIVGTSKPAPAISIRGLAGPYAVVAKGMVPGTTVADIESAMTPVGGVVLSCRMIAERPKVIAEIVFETKEGADNVVDTFHNANADGSLLQVYHKTGPVTYTNPASPAPRAVTPLGTRNDDRSRSGYASDRYTRDRSRERRRSYSRDEVLDGSYGFGDQMDTDEPTKPLYSDTLIGSKGRGSVYKDSRGRGSSDRSRGYR